MSSDWFYNPDQKLVERTTKIRYFAVEMETHILYALANKFNKESIISLHG